MTMSGIMSDIISYSYCSQVVRSSSSHISGCASSYIGQFISIKKVQFFIIIIKIIWYRSDSAWLLIVVMALGSCDNNNCRTFRAARACVMIWWGLRQQLDIGIFIIKLSRAVTAFYRIGTVYWLGQTQHSFQKILF